LSADPMTEPLAPIVSAILKGIDPAALGTTGTLSPGFNIFDGSPLGLVDAPISAISTDDVWEVGYKGLFADKLGVSLDIYNVTQKNNSQFTAISPAYALLGIDALPGDLGTNVSAAFGPQLEAALIGAGFSAEEAAGTAAAITPIVAGAYQQAGDAALNSPSPAFGGLSLGQLIAALPFHATTATDQVPSNGVNHLAAGYRTFDERNYWGADLGLEYYVNNDISVFGNYSWVNTNEFMQNVVGVEGAPLPSYLNIPQNKFRLGVNYAPEVGLRGSLSFQHDDSYFAAAGQFSGDTEVRNLVDASVGYRFASGLAIDLSAVNLFNNDYRYLPNMPRLGRRTLAKVSYAFGSGE
ncbi:MAG: TonB-dependent receptor, partial [Saprospiraceae bacterium]